MKKNSVVFVVFIAIMAMILGACNTAAPHMPSYKEGLRDQCFALGGLLDKDAKCVLPATSTDEKTSDSEKTQSVDEKLAYCMQYTTTFGKMGTFHAVYDSNMETCVIGAWESNRVNPSTDWAYTLADLKETGDSYEFLMPWRGQMNHSAEFVFVNSKPCTPANPVRCENQNTFPAGTKIQIVSAPGNDSSGPFLIMVPFMVP